MALMRSAHSFLPMSCKVVNTGGQWDDGSLSGVVDSATAHCCPWSLTSQIGRTQMFDEGSSSREETTLPVSSRRTTLEKEAPLEASKKGNVEKEKEGSLLQTVVDRYTLRCRQRIPSLVSVIIVWLNERASMVKWMREGRSSKDTCLSTSTSSEIRGKMNE